jgi:ketosteroid isomerase-like protein
MTETVSEQRGQHIERLYAAFNRRDIDTVLAGLTRDVAWANGMHGGHVHGHDGVRNYWTQQFTQIRSTVQPQRLLQQSDGRVAVDVHQVVHSVDGSQLLADTTVRHVFTFDDDNSLVRRFDIE